MQAQKVNWSVLAAARFFLALVVVCDHSCIAVPPNERWMITGFGGYLAVISFLIISGFSIASSIQRQPQGFARRRYYRVYPVYLVAFIVAQIPWLLYGPMFPTQTQTFEAPLPGHELLPLISSGLLLQAFVPGIGTLGQAWTLAVECVYYAFAPLLMKLGARVIWSIISVSALAFWQLPMHGYTFYPAWTSYGFGLALLAWAWLFGWALYHYPLTDEIKLGLFVVADFIVIPYAQNTMTAFTLLIMAWIFTYGVKKITSPRLSKWMDWLGDISYPLYMIHLPILILFGGTGKAFTELQMVTVSLIGAAVILYGVDYPVRKWRRRAEKRSSERNLLHSVSAG